MVHIRTLIRLVLVAALAVPLMAGCGGDNDSRQKTVTISGAFALYPMVVKWSDEYPDDQVKFDISAGGAGKGMSDVLSGAADIAMVSREVRAEETDQGARAFAVAKDAVVAVVNADHPQLDQLLAAGLTPEAGAAIWLTGETATWGGLLGTDDDAEIHVYTRADASGAAEVWAQYLGGKAQEELRGTAVQGDPGLAEAVRQDPLGIGYNNIGFAYDPSTGQPVAGLRVLPLDLDGDGQISDDENFYATQSQLAAAISDGRYPSPPSRPLYLVTKGEPDSTVTEFLRWVLTDGQQFVSATGYVALPAEALEAAQSGLERNSDAQ